MDMKRILQHLITTDRRVARDFPPASLQAIEQAIHLGETEHAGQVRFAVEGALELAPLLRGQSSRERAVEVFSLLRIWDTEQNCGVLIYLLLADRAVEIVADRGITARIPAEQWQLICRAMENDFRHGDYEDGVISGIHAVTRHLAEQFPARGSSSNELPDAPVVL